MLQSDEVKLKLLKLWEESLYQEFSLAKQSLAGGNGGTKGDPCGLSSSMRYKLRKKHPCPIELEQELRVKNARLPKVVHDGLNAWLKSHKENPYPNKRDKDLLSTKLGITPQQVNRWFIQRRKMIRLRGVDYVGRFDSPLDDYPHDAHDAYMEDEDLNSNDSYDGEMANYHHNHEALSPPSLNDPNSSSLLKSILTVNQTSNSSHPLPLGLSSGGTVQVMDNIKQNISRLLISEEDILTPPPSISGDSTARATPSDFPLEMTVTTSNAITVEQREALDLSVEARNARLQSYKMNHSDMPTSAESSARSSACSSPHKDYSTIVNLSLGLEEQIAVNALLTLSHGGL
ncbi:iroquois-class homeodomain protein IRX-1-like isoform X2 [Tigriopus californicus]|nr:iroquois-class homeodomain protein IRX-1-like isoform X2 [Tigriopus californicus]XP_059079028.1 iroquois-class homeodomain protein IRX-1-like isoform X2 [Tigriopus californicus]